MEAGESSAVTLHVALGNSYGRGRASKAPGIGTGEVLTRQGSSATFLLPWLPLRWVLGPSAAPAGFISSL